MSVTFNEQRSLIDFYTKPLSRNGAKVAIILEELGLPYNLHKLPKEDHDHDDGHFPHDAEHPLNGPRLDHLPLLEDVHPSGHKITLIETGSIVQYLTSRYDKDHRISYPKDSPEEAEVNNWLFFVTSRLGPNHNEAVHFARHAPEQIPYPIQRFTSKTLRLLLTLEQHLEKTKADFIVRNQITIADIAHVPYVAAAELAGIDIEQFPHVTAWYNRMVARPAVKKGLNILELENL